MRELTALLLADDRPGHYHLSDGVIAAARRVRPVEVVRVAVRRRWSSRILALLSNAGAPPALLLRAAYGLDPSAIPRADLIVSAGVETLAANIAAARLTGAANIYNGSLRWFRPENLRLVLTSYATHGDRPRHVMVLKPSALGAGPLASEGARLAPGAVPERMGLLLGGDSGECRFADGEWEKLLGFVEASHEALGVRWTVSNSRRTPAAVSDAFAALADMAAGAVAAFVDVRVAGPGTLGRVLEHAQAVVCTDDSSTMVSECVSVRLAVLGARPVRAEFTPEEQGYRGFLAENGWYRSIAIAELTPERLVADLAGIRPLEEDPLDRLAGILRERLPELFDV
ncbi:MAG: mitochondrial fission ELM1 family protein [Hyphomicrobiaceae bacterium]|nr:mitochondrial fission ELM1 family protein [Hyphomicrobiaceae bacterium]